MPEDQPSFSEQDVQQRLERIGRDLVERELYAEAIEEYKDLLRDFPRSRWAANALMGIAECFRHLGQTEEELQTLEAIADQFPDHVVAKRAQAALHLLRGSDAPSQAQQAAAAAASSRQARRLQALLVRYLVVGWLLMLAVVLLVWRKAESDMDYKIRAAALGIGAPAPAVSEPPRPRPAHPAPAPPRPGPAKAAPPAVSSPPPAPAVSSPPPAAPPARTYTVKSGDTLWLVAKRELGDARRLKEIAQLNGLQDPYPLRVGDKLRLPPRKK